jgi:hypothetical protein
MVGDLCARKLERKRKVMLRWVQPLLPPRKATLVSVGLVFPHRPDALEVYLHFATAQPEFLCGPTPTSKAALSSRGERLHSAFVGSRRAHLAAKPFSRQWHEIGVPDHKLAANLISGGQPCFVRPLISGGGPSHVRGLLPRQSCV